MEAILFFTEIFLLGLLFSLVLAPKVSLGEYVGLAFPIGFGIVSVLMLGFNFAGVIFAVKNLSITISILIIVLAIASIKMKVYNNLIDLKSLKKLKQINFAWIFCFGAIVYILYAMTAKAMFWPTAALDSVAGYDFMAKVVAAEGSFDNSIFDVQNPIMSIRNSYPPLVPSSFSFAHSCGLESSKIVSVIFLISVALFFWSLFRRYMTELGAILLTLFMLTVPEFIAMSSLSLTNVPQTFYAASGSIMVYLFTKNNSRKYLLFGAFLLGMNAWTRTDGIVFVASWGIVILIDFVRKKRYKEIKNAGSLILYGAIGILPLLSWQIFTKFNIPNIYSNKDAFVDHLFFDTERISQLWDLIFNLVSNSQLYGVFFMTALILTVIHVKYLWTSKDLLFIGIVLSFLLYAFLFYQMDFGSKKFGFSMNEMINSSFKRGMFPFIPTLCFYMGTLPLVHKTLEFVYKPIKWKGK